MTCIWYLICINNNVNVISFVDVSVIPFIDINKTMFNDGKVIPCINNTLILCTNPIIFIMHFIHHNHALNHITYYVHRAAASGKNNGYVQKLESWYAIARY